MSLVDAVLEASSALGAGRVTAIYVRLGTQSGVAEEALRLSFGMVTDGTPIAGTELVIDASSPIVCCDVCGHRGELAPATPEGCERCGSPVHVEGSRDLQLVGLEVSDEPTTTES